MEGGGGGGAAPLAAPHPSPLRTHSRGSRPACATPARLPVRISTSFLLRSSLFGPWPRRERALLQSGDSQVGVCPRVRRVTGGEEKGGGVGGGWVGAGAGRSWAPPDAAGRGHPRSRRHGRSQGRLPLPPFLLRWGCAPALGLPALTPPPSPGRPPSSPSVCAL